MTLRINPTSFVITLTLALAGVGLILHPGSGYPMVEYFDRWLWNIVEFSILQAAMSAIFATAIAVPFAIVLASRPFRGQWVVKGMLNLFFIMPVLTIILGVVSAYSAWFDVFSLKGILAAHLYLNVPYAIRIFWERLERIAPRSIQLSQTLGFSRFQQFWWVKRPVIVDALRPVFVLIFLLCFSSFTVVLTLGGGPANTNLEVAIFQALKFDFDPRAGALYALFHGLIAAFFIIFLGRRDALKVEQGASIRRVKSRASAVQFVTLVLLFLILLYPLLALFNHALTTPWVGSSRLLQGISTSLMLAGGSAAFATFLALSRSLQTRQSRWHRFMDFGLLVLPIMAVTTGLFLIALKLNIAFKITTLLIIWLNGLMALPLVVAPLNSRIQVQRKKYQRLGEALGLNRWFQIRWIFAPAILAVLPWVFTLAFVLSVGDLGVAALLGSAQFVTLPILIYQAMGSYQMVLASQLTLILLVICAVCLLLAEWVGDRHYVSR